jgi:periplasmic protein TonB
MNLKPTGVSGSELGSLRSCLVEGDSIQQQRARKIRRRALGFSIVLQTLFVASLVLFPLLSRGERIELKNFTPIPPYPSYGHPARNPKPNSHPAPRHFSPTVFFSPKPLTQDVNRANDDPAAPDFPIGTEDGRDHGTPFSSPTSGPARPDKNVVEHHEVEKTRRVTISQLQPAMLSYRVEPIYPAIPKLMHREGRVELRAVIATDGSIQSLEVASGDPLFYQSALAAVREWRYKPTILNGRPVEVDTHISVVYTLPK